jgi:hypothetical protein
VSLGGMFGDMQSEVCARSAQQALPGAEAEGRSIPERDTGTLYRLKLRPYSHSIVAGGFEEMSRATRLTSRISLMIRFETRSSRS